MKVGDFNIFKDYFEKNPDALEAPDSLIEDTTPVVTTPDNPNQVTIEDLLEQVKQLKESLDNNKNDTSAKEIEDLKAEVKSMKEESQRQAQSEATIPQEPTADDVIRKFITGGK